MPSKILSLHFHLNGLDAGRSLSIPASPPSEHPVQLAAEYPGLAPVIPKTMYLVGRSAWSLQPSKMAVGLGSKAADEEARAEVEVLNSRLEKTSQLSKKIQASLSRLESNGKSMQDAIGPVYGNTQRLQVLGSSTKPQGYPLDMC